MTIAQPQITLETLWYTKSAEQWVEALPVGNGRLGAMIFANPENKRFQLNEITVWSGDPQPDADRKDAYKHLNEIKRLSREGRYKKAIRTGDHYELRLKTKKGVKHIVFPL